MKKWHKLPLWLQNEAVKPYYEILKQRSTSLIFKRLFDFFMSLLLLLTLAPVLLVLSLLIVIDSKGGVFYRQERVTRYGNTFKIFKFRTMVSNADKIGSLVTVADDSRITKIGKVLRKTRLDETPQLLNILFGQMSFVGTRPEVAKYVLQYSDEMQATLLMRAGVTSLASLAYKDEAEILAGVAPEDIDDIYIRVILPQKMKYNLEEIKQFSFWHNIRTMLKTVRVFIFK